jgi:predicted Zn-dependent peptidase
MSNLARQEMYFDKFFDLDEIIDRVEAVTAEQLRDMATEMFTSESIAVTVLGNLDGMKLPSEALAC